MSKPLSYHNSVNGEHWFKSVAYGKAQIDAMADPQGGNSKDAPTSIPSPFARFDLVKTAFANLASNPNLNGTSNDQRLVSNALDIGEVLFNYETFKDSLKIVPWSSKNLNTLQNSSNPGHKQLGDVLDLYLKQDAKAYNFDKIQRLFIVFYKGEAIGGTSSSTLFFSSANDLSSLTIPFGKQPLLGTTPVPLYQRDIEYQKMWYCLKMMPGFQQNFKELDNYLEICLRELKRTNPSQYKEHIRTDNGTDLIDTTYYSDNYEQLNTSLQNDDLEVIGFPLRKKKSDSGTDIQTKSGFVIKSSLFKQLYPKALTPLALQNNFNKSIFYTQAYWDSSVEVPPYSPLSWKANDRMLPGQANKYPWLTINDFLEPYLIKVPYPLNGDAFYMGKVECLQENRGYLIPLKKDFFDFFKPEDLENGTVKLSMVARNNGAILVTLEIPIIGDGAQQSYISFEKTYIPGDEENIPSPNLVYNEGFIIEQKFTLNIFPLIKSGDYSLPADYRIQVIEKKGINSDIKIDFYDAATNQRVPSTIDKYRNPRNGQLSDVSKYYIQKNEFDYLTVEFNTNSKDLQAALIPKWFKYNGKGKQYSFAIDFGTSNTHIEYTVGGNAPQPFRTEKIQVGTLVHPDYYNAEKVLLDLYLPFFYEFLPMAIDESTKERFPVRTAIQYSEYLDFNTVTYTLSDLNIPFYYGSESTRDKIDLNLKWGANTVGNQHKIEAFFEQLLMMIKVKVVLEGGNLDNVELYVFYPSSMQRGRINSLKSTWQSAANRVVSPLIKTNLISESIAPFYFYKNTIPTITSSVKPVLSIDIGGGTTDAVLYQNGSPTLLTSFRFASSSIFGDAFIPFGANHNGFVIKYKDYINRIFGNNGVSDQSIHENNSAEIISLWFAAEKNAETRELGDFLSFNKMLAKDEDLKVVFLLFYTAIIYHLCGLLKLKNIKKPKTITFSGTGSKMLDIITDDNEQLSLFTKVIIEKVFEEEYDLRENLAVFSDRQVPKEATCKGALMMDDNAKSINSISIATVYSATYEDKFNSISYSDLTNQDVRQSVLNEVENFIDFFFKLNKTFDFSDELNVNPEYIRLAKEILKNDLSSYLGDGIKNKLTNQMDDDKELEETLFFYPLIGAINNLAYKIGSKTIFNG